MLGKERIGANDDFFQLGGNSLLATRLVFRIRREMEVELAVSDVFEKPGLSLLAQHLLDAQLAQFDPDQIEALLNDTDPEYVALCLDTGHHAYRYGDPVAFMRKHHKRIPYLHIKSVDATMRQRVKDENIPFAIAVAQDMFCQPSQGAVDFPAFRDLLREIDYSGWGIVEQDMYPAPFYKPLPIATRTRNYLRDIGIG